MRFYLGFGQYADSKQTLQPRTLKDATPYMIRYERRWRRVFRNGDAWSIRIDGRPLLIWPQKV